MLLPALNKARDNAKTISCASNLKQLGLAFNMYANDHDEWCLPTWIPGGTTYAEELWFGRLNIDKYCTNSKLFLCPSEPESAYNISDSSAAWATAFTISYGHNLGTFGWVGHGTYKAHRMPEIAKFKDSSNLIVMGDSTPQAYIPSNLSMWILAEQGVWTSQGLLGSGGNYTPNSRHNKYMNAVMFDGRVKVIPQSILGNASDLTNWSPINRTNGILADH